jgi:steroid delta-isomerase-like uncharacterized protein
VLVLLRKENKTLIRRYYDDLWNKWDLAVADEIIAPDISFRGSLAVTANGLKEFKDYVGVVRAAFPDFYNSIDELIAEGGTVVARLTYTGTHRGKLFGIAPTGNRVTYSGIAVFKIKDGKIRDGWVLGDTQSLFRQLGVLVVMPEQSS